MRHTHISLTLPRPHISHPSSCRCRSYIIHFLSFFVALYLARWPAHRLRFTAAGPFTGHTGCVNSLAFSSLTSQPTCFLSYSAMLFFSFFRLYLLLQSHSISSLHPSKDFIHAHLLYNHHHHRHHASSSYLRYYLYCLEDHGQTQDK